MYHPPIPTNQINITISSLYSIVHSTNQPTKPFSVLISDSESDQYSHSLINIHGGSDQGVGRCCSRCQRQRSRWPPITRRTFQILLGWGCLRRSRWSPSSPGLHFPFSVMDPILLLLRECESSFHLSSLIFCRIIRRSGNVPKLLESPTDPTRTRLLSSLLPHISPISSFPILILLSLSIQSYAQNTKIIN